MCRRSNIQNDYFNKVVFDIVKTKPCKIIIEDLKIKNLMKNKALAKSFQITSISKFKTKLQNKCNEFGIKIIQANQFFASSKICNVCGYKNNELSLKDREWICPNCNTKHDRDINAAKNLQNYIPIDDGEFKSVKSQINKSIRNKKLDLLKQKNNKKTIKI
jgi:putative transposase